MSGDSQFKTHVLYVNVWVVFPMCITLYFKAMLQYGCLVSLEGICWKTFVNPRSITSPLSMWFLIPSKDCLMFVRQDFLLWKPFQLFPHELYLSRYPLFHIVVSIYLFWTDTRLTGLLFSESLNATLISDKNFK